MKRFWRLPVMKLALMSCSSTGQDIIEAQILSLVPSSPWCGWTHTPAYVTENLLSWVFGGPYWSSSAREKSHEPSCSSLLLWKPNSSKNLSLVSEVREREDEKSSSSASAVEPLWIKPYHQECSSQSWVFLCWLVWVCCLQEQMWPGRNSSWASKQLLPALVLGCSCRPAGVWQLGELGCSVLCALWWALPALDQEYLLSGLTCSCHSRVIYLTSHSNYLEAFQLSWIK